ncbi:hypothetical protein [Methylotetracoccus oryzae]|uniref:hypothetical protein n=1 Tax=Methylotetracoccus oryzae TaxID=1919059 RepID=UPI00111A3340|nr:hypothetical protein [Methylotetracoccus oryzae]
MPKPGSIGQPSIECDQVMDNFARFNFYLSVWLSIAGGILIFNRPEFIVPDAEDLFGPIRNNLLFAALILAINQVILWFTRYTRNESREALLMGLLFMLVSGGLQYYGRVNGIPVNHWCSIAAFYVGMSHVLFFWSQSRKLGPENL